jgi:hypothetical protein
MTERICGYCGDPESAHENGTGKCKGVDHLGSTGNRVKAVPDDCPCRKFIAY